MMHVPPQSFRLPPRTYRFGLPVADAPLAPLAPHEYLALRMRAAGLRVADVAAMIAPKKDDLAEANALVSLLIDMPGGKAKRRETINALLGAFSFDPDVYFQLCEDPAGQHPRICRDCGCSQWDPCDHEHLGACAWSTPARCTHCLPAVAGVAGGECDR